MATLTNSHRIVAAKRRAKKEQIKEIIFDDAARRYVPQGYDPVDIPDGRTREFLTGFHKRKLQKKEAAKKKALERERQERLEAKREVGLHPYMSDLADSHHTFIETTNACGKSCAERSRCRKGLRRSWCVRLADWWQTPTNFAPVSEEETDAGEEWGGISKSGSADKGKGKQMEEEYEYEEQVATVTVVEDFDPDELIHGPQAARKLSPTSDEHGAGASAEDTISASRSQEFQHNQSTVANPPATVVRTRTKLKPKEIKYQTNAARKADKLKQRRRKVEKAERAGGKASRRSGGSHRRR